MDNEPSPNSPKPPKPRSMGLNDFWAELKQRKVVRVAIGYAVAGWIIMEVGATILPYLGVADGLVSALIILVIFGFPVSLVVAWVYERTPQGIRSTNTVREERGESGNDQSHSSKQGLLFLLLAASVPTAIFGLLAVVFFFQARTADSELSALRSLLLPSPSPFSLWKTSVPMKRTVSWLPDSILN